MIEITTTYRQVSIYNNIECHIDTTYKHGIINSTATSNINLNNASSPTTVNYKPTPPIPTS